MSKLKPVLIFVLLGFVCCAPKSNSNAPNSPPQVLEKATNQLYVKPQNLVKSSVNKKELNSFEIRLDVNSKPTRVVVPFYFNSEKFSLIRVLKPRFSTAGCLAGDIKLASVFGALVLGLDDGHNPDEPKVLLAYEISEELGNFNTDQTLTVIFQAPADCTNLTFEFESFFE